MSTVADKTEVRKDCTVQLIQVLNSHNGSDQSNGINIRTKSRLNDTKRLFDNCNPEDRIYEPTKRSLFIYTVTFHVILKQLKKFAIKCTV